MDEENLVPGILHTMYNVTYKATLNCKLSNSISLIVSKSRSESLIFQREDIVVARVLPRHEDIRLINHED